MKFELNTCIFKKEQGEVKGQGLLQSSLTMYASEDALASEFERYALLLVILLIPFVQWQLGTGQSSEAYDTSVSVLQ